MTKKLVTIVILLIICLSRISILAKNQTVAEKNPDIEVIGCSDNLSVDALKQLLKGQGELVIPKGESECLLSFGEAIDLQDIQVSFNDNNSTEVGIINTDQKAVKKFDRLDCGGGYTDITSAFICMRFESKKENIITKMQVFGKPLSADYIKEENEIVLEENNPENPLYPYRRPVKRCIYTLAENILGKEAARLSTHEKITCFMDYISEFKVGSVSFKQEEYLQKLILNQIGSCGDYSNLLAALCVTQGIKTRLLTLGNYPEGSGHAVTEVLVNGKWSMYDPTYALYYTTTPKNTKSPNVLSFQELKLGMGKNKNVRRVIGSNSHITSQYSYRYMGPEIYEKANPSGIVSPQSKLCYPISYTYKGEEEIRLTKYQGTTYLGAACINNSQLWEISGLQPGKEYKFVVRSTGICGEYASPLKTYADIEYGIIKSGCTNEWNRNGQNEWNIQFIPNDPIVRLKLDHGETGDQLHYLALETVKIGEAGVEAKDRKKDFY